MNRAVQAYFAGDYPGRTGWRAALLCRRGEDKRLQLYQSWLSCCDGWSILDAGCGDGVFLARLLRGRPARIRLEDIVSNRVREARARLAARADVVEGEATDVAAARDGRRYDLVLALGVFDYADDWPALLGGLLARTGGRLVADFPKRGTLHDALRRIWLRLHGITLASATRSDLERLFRACAGSARVVELPLHWAADIRPRAC